MPHKKSIFSPVAEDHALNPRNNGSLSTFNGHARITGPCGDTMEVWILVHKNKIEAITFETDGCGTSHACGSMMTCLAEGSSLSFAFGIGQREILDALGGLPEGSQHCALLAANTLAGACNDYLANNHCQ
jgi:nitrogen fixation NifU-like protein